MLNLINDIFRRIVFCHRADRIGPDLFWTHWHLYFKNSMIKLCKSKFKSFADTADFRPGSYAHFTSMISIGERVTIRPGTVLGADEKGQIIIEEDVLIGMNVHIYADNHNFDDPTRPISEQGYTASDAILKKGAWIGANAIILPGVTIGQNSVVGGGSIVTKDVPDYCVVVGNPAKVIKKIES